MTAIIEGTFDYPDQHHNDQLTKTSKIFTLSAVSAILFFTPIPLHALDIFSLIWWLKFSFSSKYKSKCFWQEVWATEQLLKVTVRWSTLEDLHENITSWACLDKSRLKDISHW